MTPCGRFKGIAVMESLDKLFLFLLLRTLLRCLGRPQSSTESHLRTFRLALCHSCSMAQPTGSLECLHLCLQRRPIVFGRTSRRAFTVRQPDERASRRGHSHGARPGHMRILSLPLPPRAQDPLYYVVYEACGAGGRSMCGAGSPSSRMVPHNR